MRKVVCVSLTIRDLKQINNRVSFICAVIRISDIYHHILYIIGTYLTFKVQKMYKKERC